MQRDSIMRLSRRQLLTGIASMAALAAIAPQSRAPSDQIVIRDGWLLKESDLA